MKRAFFIFVAAISISGCLAGSGENRSLDVAESNYSEFIGNDYPEFRAEFMNFGWSVIPAICNEKNLCLDYPELATNMASRKTCGEFKKLNRRVRVCVKVDTDKMSVDSIDEI